LKSSIKRGVRVGALGVASALALGGVFATSASATEGEAAPTDGAAFDQLAAEFFQDDSVKGVLYDENGNIIVQQLETGSTAAQLDAGTSAAQIADRYSNVTILPASEEDIAQPAASTDVVGGYGIGLFDDTGAGGVCSVGFPALSPDGQPAIITAGHCTGDGASNNVFLTDPKGDTAGGGAEDLSTVTVTHEVGQVGFNQFGGTGNTEGSTEDALDIAVIDVTNENLDLHAAMTDWANTDDLSASIASPITGVGTAEFGGEPIQRSGRTTGYSSGPYSEALDPLLDYKGYLEVDGRLVKGFAAEIEVIPGDSGGTVLQGSTAVGVVTAYANLTDGRKFMWAHDLQTGLAATGGYTIQTQDGGEQPEEPEEPEEPQAPGAPELTSHEDGANIAWNGELSGTGEANQTLEYVFGERGGDTKLAEGDTAEINADGEWTITAPSAPGDYTLRLRVNAGDDNVSDVVEYDINVFPSAPGITSPTDGSNNTEHVTAITGEGAAPNAAIILSGDVNAEVDADENGNWSHAVDLGQGEYTVSAQQTVNGKISDKNTISFKVGAEKPAAPELLNPVDGGSYTEGKAPGTFTGTGINGATVEVSVDGNVVGEAPVDGNVWSLQVDQLAVGEHTISVRQNVDGAWSDAVEITVTVTAAEAPEEPNDPEEPNEAPEETPAPEQPKDDQNNNDDDQNLVPTGAEFDGAAPLGIAFGLVFAAGAVLIIARVRQVKSQR
jgi:hypothetical protein